jgi:hypothetical protein
MPYCPRCGNEVSEDADYCSRCRGPLREGLAYRRVRRRKEKNEKNEKQEKDKDDKYGPIIGGLIVTWLGALLLLSNQNIIRSSDFGGYFLMGIGVILVIRGVLAYQESSLIESSYGYLIGGGVVAMIGLGITYNLRDWWAVILVGLGLVIILRGIIERNKNPFP